MKDQKKAEQKYFETLHPGTMQATFLLHDEPLRRWVYRFDFIESMEDTRKVPLSNILAAQDCDEFLSHADNEDTRGVAELIRAVVQARETLAEVAEARRQTGLATFDELPYVLAKNTEVVVTTEPGVRHGALITFVRQGYSIFGGPYATIGYRFVVFDGQKFIFTDETQHVNGFQGELPLKKLGVEIMTGPARDQLIRHGEHYRDLNTSPAHMHYTGTLVQRSWFGDRHFRADGRVMVDIKSFVRLDPNYRDFYGSIRDDNEDQTADITDPKVLMLASPYVYGYSLMAKAWGEMRVSGLRPIVYRTDAFDRLVLDAQRKRIIRALVEADLHSFHDIVENKGAGCIFLLAGPPGVGKTVTAEATAENLKRPLYMVSAGELGTEPGTVEESLKDILDMASTWNAILLIDECDIFLERRTKEDIHRNALVSIFLRMLEYYDGILFLTTNRVGEIDPAFLSRISIALEYPELDAATREQVWRNLAAGHDFAADFAALAQHRLNGREIKHCLRLALALAQHEERAATQTDIEAMIAMGQEFRAAIAEHR